MPIECRTKGIPMRDGTRVEADGAHVFTLDDTRHDPFAVLDRLMIAAGYVAPAIDRRFDAMKVMKPHELARYDVGYADHLKHDAEAKRK